MKNSAVFATLLLSVVTYSANALSAADGEDSAYSIEIVAGEMPVRNVVVKQVGQHFTSYVGFQFDCSTQKYTQTGFYNSPEGVMAELSTTKYADTFNYSSFSNTMRLKACELEPGLNITDTTQPPSAS